MTPFITSIALAAAISAASIADPDSIDTAHPDTLSASVMLKGVEIKASRSRMIDNGVAVIPTKWEKQASTGMGGMELLRRMRPPMLTIHTADNTITMSTGLSVSYFIDGMEATPEQINGLRTSEVLRVEVLSNPSDPKYSGASGVVNFVMKKINYGGYVTLNGRQQVGYVAGHYSVYTKFVNGVHSLEATASLNTTNDNGLRTVTHADFNMTGADGPDYVLERDAETTDNFHQQRWNGGLLWRWTGNKSYVQAVAGLEYERDPHQDRTGIVAYNRADVPVQKMSERQWARYTTPYSHLRAYFTFPRNTTLSILASVNVSDNSTRREYLATDMESPLVNTTDQTGVATLLRAILSRNFKGGFNLRFMLEGRPRFYNITYGGVASAHRRLRHDDYSATLTLVYNVNKLWTLTASGALPYSGVSVKGISSMHQLQPTLLLMADGSLSDSHRLSAFFQNTLRPNRIGAYSEVDQPVNEVEGTAGNPDLRRGVSYVGSVAYTWLPANDLDITVLPYVQHIAHHDQTVYFQKGDMVFNTLANSGSLNRITLELSANWRLLSNRLAIAPYFGVRRWIRTGIYAERFWSTYTELSADWYIDNHFSIEASALAPHRIMVEGDGSTSHNKTWNVSVGARYFKGNVNVGLTVRPFYRRFREVETYSGGIVNLVKDYYTKHNARGLELSLSYIIDYGLKQRHISNMSSGESIRVSR